MSDIRWSLKNGNSHIQSPSPAHHGLLRMLSYILQTLSSDKEFAVSLNQYQRLTFPMKWAIAGTTGDLLIAVSDARCFGVNSFEN